MKFLDIFNDKMSSNNIELENLNNEKNIDEFISKINDIFIEQENKPIPYDISYLYLHRIIIDINKRVNNSDQVFMLFVNTYFNLKNIKLIYNKLKNDVESQFRLRPIHKDQHICSILYLLTIKYPEESCFGGITNIENEEELYNSLKYNFIENEILILEPANKYFLERCEHLKEIHKGTNQTLRENLDYELQKIENMKRVEIKRLKIKVLLDEIIVLQTTFNKKCEEFIEITNKSMNHNKNNGSSSNSNIDKIKLFFKPREKYYKSKDFIEDLNELKIITKYIDGIENEIRDKRLEIKSLEY